jgi:hypothetical protein
MLTHALPADICRLFAAYNGVGTFAIATQDRQLDSLLKGD